MSVSGKTAAPFENPYFEPLDKPPDLNAVTKAMAERAHLLGEKTGSKELLNGTAGAGQLLIAQAGSIARYKAMKGDATLAEDGTLTVADKAVTSRKFKPTAGIKELSETKVLTEAYADMPLIGGNLEITPAVTSNLKVTLIAEMSLAAGAIAFATLSVDGVDEPKALISSSAGVFTGTLAQVFFIPLTVTLHTIKLRAKKSGGTAAELKAEASSTSKFMYELVSS